MSENANAIRLAVFTAIIYISAITVGLRLLYYLAYVLAAVLIAAFLWSRINRLGLQVRRKVEPSQAQVGQVVQELIEVNNTLWLPKLWLEIRDRSTLPRHRIGAVISLGAGKNKKWRVRTRCTQRGVYHVGPTAILTGDPFGLFRVSRVFNQTNEVLVYPPTVPLSSFGIPESELPGGTHTQQRAYHTTPNAAGLRDYLPGDPMNRIHWPATARSQKLIVKEFELDPTADLWLILDMDEEVHSWCSQEDVETVELTPTRPSVPESDLPYAKHGGPSLAGQESDPLRIDPNTEEYSIVVAASIAAALISQGRSVGFIASGQHKIVLPADRGGRQLLKILRALAVLNAEGTVPLEELLVGETRQFSRQDTLVIITPSLQEEWVDALQSQLHRGVRATAVIVEPSTFCGDANALMLVSALSALDVPSYLVKRDDSIDASLSRHYGRGTVRNMR